MGGWVGAWVGGWRLRSSSLSSPPPCRRRRRPRGQLGRSVGPCDALTHTNTNDARRCTQTHTDARAHTHTQDSLGIAGNNEHTTPRTTRYDTTATHHRLRLFHLDLTLSLIHLRRFIHLGPQLFAPLFRRTRVVVEPLREVQHRRDTAAAGGGGAVAVAGITTSATTHIIHTTLTHLSLLLLVLLLLPPSRLGRLGRQHRLQRRQDVARVEDGRGRHLQAPLQPTQCLLHQRGESLATHTFRSMSNSSATTNTTFTDCYTTISPCRGGSDLVQQGPQQTGSAFAHALRQRVPSDGSEQVWNHHRWR